MTVHKVIFGIASLAVGAVACSSTNDPLFQPVTCGDGTVERDGKCVVADAGEDLDSGAAVDASGDAIPDAPSGPDACPSYPLQINCDTECGEGINFYKCEYARCRLIGYKDGYPVDALNVIPTDSPYAIRTPNKPGHWPDCYPRCDGTDVIRTVAYAVGFRIERPVGKYRITVGDPWVIEENGRNERMFCAYESPKTARYRGCVTASDEKTFTVWTQDPNAVARNIVIQAVPDSEGCP
jgi:hypothetical protein